MKNKAKIIQVDMDDTKETLLIKQLNINTKSTNTTTVVINSQGQLTGSFNGVNDVKKLIESANKVASGGCCPGGSKSKGCGK
jgi:hypothetical protein